MLVLHLKEVEYTNMLECWQVSVRKQRDKAYRR